MSDWEELLNKYGGDLKKDPQSLRLMFINILLPDLKQKIMGKLISKYPTWQSIHQYVKDKMAARRDQSIADALHRPTKKPAGSLNAMGVEHPETAPIAPTEALPPQPRMATFDDLQNMMNAMAGQRPPKGGGKGGKGDRGKGGKGNKFIFKGCYECGAPDHSRIDCDAWKRILDADGRPPAGHQGKKDRALATWKAKRAAASGKGGGGKVNALGVSQDDDYDDYGNTEDEDDYYEAPPHMFNALGVRKPSLTAQDAVPENDFEFLNSFAHVVQLGRKVPQKFRSPVKISSEADLAKQEVKDLMHALPRDKKSLDQLARLCPTDTQALKKGEIWVMADTGSTVNGIDVATELPDYEHLVQQTPEDECDPGAECADGSTLKAKGTVNLTGWIDGKLHTVAFKDMATTMPIASMVQTVKKGNDLLVTPTGGTITNRKSGHVVKLHERLGVYFFKMQLLSPAKQCQPQQDWPKLRQPPRPSSSGFRRPA